MGGAYPLLLSGLTLDDVRITTSMVMPLLDAVKSVFMLIFPYLIAVFCLRIAGWLIPVVWRKVAQKKS